ncbi:MAG: hypothetical protein ACOZE5_11355 [Verrucomicrobiota bacterium]
MLQLGIALLFLVGLTYTVTTLFSVTKNTLNVSVAAFAMLVALANGFFAFGRAVEEDKDLRDKISFCGERALQAALCMLVATIVKWGFLEYYDFLGDGGRAGWIYRVQEYACSWIVGLLFFCGVVESHRALDQVFDILEDRRNRRADVPR